MTAPGRSIRLGSAGALLVVVVVAAACSPATPTPAAVGPTQITLVASGIAYEPASVAVPAGVPMMVTFDHRDAGVPHGLTLLAGARTLVTEEPIIGPIRQVYTIDGLIPGTYQFSCVVHPNMLSDLVVEGG